MPRTLTLLLPCSIPPEEVLRSLDAAALPATLARCVARAAAVTREDHDEYFLRSLPHERWLLQQTGRTPNAGGSVPTAAWRLRGDRALAGASPAESVNQPQGMDSMSGWNCLELTHVHATHDQLLLAPPWQLQITAAESSALLDTARQVLDGITVVAPLPHRWYLHAPTLAGCETTSILRAAGHNIDSWMPAGPQARQWRRLQNEIQMIWHDHPVNEARALRGWPAINSLWLHGGTPNDEAATTARWKSCGGMATLCPEIVGCALASGATWQPATALQAITLQAPGGALEGDVLAICDALIAPCLDEDWGNWLGALEMAERDWLAPALAALRGGAFRQLDIVVASESHWLQVTVPRGDLWKFWRKRDLRTTLRTALFAETTQ